MRFALIFVLLFILRFIFLPIDVGTGIISFLYHIFVGAFIGMTAFIIEVQLEKHKNKKKKK